MYWSRIMTGQLLSLNNTGGREKRTVTESETDWRSFFTLKWNLKLKAGNKSVWRKCSQQTDEHFHTVRTHRCFCIDSDQPSEDEDEAGSSSSLDGSDFSTGECSINCDKLDDTRWAHTPKCHFFHKHKLLPGEKQLI